MSNTNSYSPPKLMSIELVMPFNHLILCRPLLLLPSIFPSIRVFSNESALRIRWPKYWSFSRHLILCHPLLLLLSIFPSIRVFSNESALRMRWLKYWRFSFSIGPSNEHPGLISFRMDWLDLLAVHGTLKSLLPHHSSEASILRRSAFFTVQLSHPYMTTGKI